MEVGALDTQEIRVHGFAHERVAEAEKIAAGSQHVRADRFTQRRRDAPTGRFRSRAKQDVIGRPSHHRCRPRDLPSCFGEPLSAVEDLLGHSGLRFGIKDLRELDRDLSARQPTELDVSDPAAAGELSEQDSQRVVAIELVRAICGDHRHGLAGTVNAEVADEVTRRRVGPVHVLQHEQSRRFGAQPVQQPQQQLE